MFEQEGLRCIRCGTEFPSLTLFEGCPQCRQVGRPSNVTVTYSKRDVGRPQSTLTPGDVSMWRYRAFLGVPDSEVTLGEGLTPLIACNRLADRYRIGALSLKDESQNPTGSYKDRLCSASVTRAVIESAPGVASSSTGNHGAATAAYAARAGLPCVIFTLDRAPETMKLHMQAFGAKLVATPEPRDRWVLLRYCVDELGWYSTGNFSDPPVGSSPYGVEGHKTLAYELAESCDWSPPDVVVMPVAYGDGIFGVYKGFRDLLAAGWIDYMPRLVAAETAGSLAKALAENLDEPPELPVAESVALSIDTPVSTFQALTALRESDGTAVLVSEEQILHAQDTLAATEGLFVEAASAAVVAAIQQLVETGQVTAQEHVAGVLTSSGLKNPAVVRRYRPQAPVVEPNVDQLRQALLDAYDFDLPG